MKISVLLILFLSTIAEATRPIPASLDKWWPMCILDGSGSPGAVNTHVREMVRMAAECGVFLQIEAKPLQPGASGKGAAAFAKAAAEKCNITYGYEKDYGVNRGSVLAIVGDTGTAKQLCAANGAKEREFCGQLGFDPGESQKFRMRNTGYFGGVAKEGDAAFSVVSGKAINARDMSAVALGQGMMSLPQGFGAGNGVGGEYEGQAAGGSNVDSGWSDLGCKKMRAAAFNNPNPNKKFLDVKETFSTTGNIKYVDIYDAAVPPFFGRPGMPPSYGLGAAVARAAVSGASSAMSAKPALSSQSDFFKTPSGRASVNTGSPDGHGRSSDSAVTSIRNKEEIVKPPAEGVSLPSTLGAKAGSRLSTDDDAKIDPAYAASLGLDSSQISNSVASAPASAAAAQSAAGGVSESFQNSAAAMPAATSGSAAEGLLQAVKENTGAATASSVASSGSSFKDFSTSKTAATDLAGSGNSAGPAVENNAAGFGTNTGSTQNPSLSKSTFSKDFYRNSEESETEASEDSGSRRPSSVDAYGERGKRNGSVVRIGR